MSWSCGAARRKKGRSYGNRCWLWYVVLMYVRHIGFEFSYDTDALFVVLESSSFSVPRSFFGTTLLVHIVGWHTPWLLDGMRKCPQAVYFNHTSDMADRVGALFNVRRCIGAKGSLAYSTRRHIICKDCC